MTHNNSDSQAPSQTSAPIVTRDSDLDTGLAAAAIVGLGVAIFRSRWLPGMFLGVASMMAPRFFPGLGPALRPLVKNALRAGYMAAERAKELTAEATEQFQDIVAEVRYEQEIARTESKDGH